MCGLFPTVSNMKVDGFIKWSDMYPAKWHKQYPFFLLEGPIMLHCVIQSVVFVVVVEPLVGCNGHWVGWPGPWGASISQHEGSIGPLGQSGGPLWGSKRCVRGWSGPEGNHSVGGKPRGSNVTALSTTVISVSESMVYNHLLVISPCCSAVWMYYVKLWVYH